MAIIDDLNLIGWAGVGLLALIAYSTIFANGGWTLFMPKIWENDRFSFRRPPFFGPAYVIFKNSGDCRRIPIALAQIHLSVLAEFDRYPLTKAQRNVCFDIAFQRLGDALEGSDHAFFIYYLDTEPNRHAARIVQHVNREPPD